MEMRKAVTRASRPIIWALMVAFAVALSADCLAGAEMTEAQMACCATMGSECGHRAQDKTCCSTESQPVDQVTAVKRVTTPLPDAVFAPVGVVVETALHSLVPLGHNFDGFTPKPPGVPRYLLVSTLLI
jgi:hypothetical protein